MWVSSLFHTKVDVVQPSYGESHLASTLPCVSLPATKKPAHDRPVFPAGRYTPRRESSQPPDSNGHTPRKLPACAAISRIIADCAPKALRYHTTPSRVCQVFLKKFFVFFAPLPPAVVSRHFFTLYSSLFTFHSLLSALYFCITCNKGLFLRCGGE